MSARLLRGGIAGTAMLFATCAAALGTHAALEWTQAIGVLPGDYGRHAHGLLAPVALGALTIGAAALFLYAAHLAGLGTRSLPSLARQFHASLDWRAATTIAAGAALLLVAMESSEQLACGRFDGFLSAFSGVPAAGIGLIAALSAATVCALRAFCRWLACAHATLVFAIQFLRRVHPIAAATGRIRSWLKPVLSRYAVDAAHAFGMRAPPFSRSTTLS